MANATLQLNVIGYGYTSKSEPTTVFDISEQDHVRLTSGNNYDEKNRLYIKFANFPSNLKRNRLYSASAVFRLNGFSNNAIPHLKSVDSEFNPATLTWETQPNAASELIISTTYRVYSDNDYAFDFMPEAYTAAQKSQLAAELLKNSTAYLCAIYKQFDAYYKKLSDGTNAPYIEILYDDSTYIQSKIEIVSGATGGYVNPRQSARFAWRYVQNDSSGYSCADSTFGQTSAVFYWKKSTDQSYTAINISGNTKEVTVAANTFPAASTINWYVSGTDDVGGTSQTPVYSFSTAAGTVTTDPISPINTIESNNAPITFRWTYSSPDGYAPIKQIFYWKLITDVSWTALETFNDARTTYTAPANTFPAGEIMWGVTPYNIDNIAGTGNTATIISYGAPEAPIVYATETPFTEITWQADDQQAYKIIVDDTEYGPYFGTEKKFNLPDYLTDGNHTIKVSIVGSYGLWSDYGQTEITIENTPGEDVTLDGAGGIDNRLTWITEEATADFLIYRDGVQIGHTAGTLFTDRFASGAHTYKVINRLTDGNYSESNELTLTAAMTGNYIAFLSGGDWLQIKYTEPGQNAPDYEESIETVYNHLAGNGFPTAVIGHYRETGMNFSAFFLRTQEEEHQLFRSMFGKPVIMKLRDGTVYIGIIDSWKKQSRTHYHTGYSFTVHRIEWEDYVDDTIPDNPV